MQHFLTLQIEVDENGKIIDAKFKTFGCGSAIASSSLATEWVKGKSLDDAGKIKNNDIAAELCLPPVKLHCSMLAEDAIKAALKDYKVKNEKKTEAVAGKQIYFFFIEMDEFATDGLLFNFRQEQN